MNKIKVESNKCNRVLQNGDTVNTERPAAIQSQQAATNTYSNSNTTQQQILYSEQTNKRGQPRNPCNLHEDPGTRDMGRHRGLSELVARTSKYVSYTY